MNKKSYKRYKRTTVRDKKNLVRSLDTFTKQYGYVHIQLVRLDSDGKIEFGKPMGLSFFEEPQQQPVGIYEGSGLIYDKDVATIDLSSYKLIMEAIDNLISINTKYEYKKALKEILEQYSEHGISYMFHWKNEEPVQQQIKKRFDCSLAYAKRVYNQLKNRIKYRYVGIYSVNDALNSKVNALTPEFLNAHDILNSKIEFLKQRAWLLNNDVVTAIKERLIDNSSQEDLITLISSFYAIEIFEEIDEDVYLDSIEYLKFCYLDFQNQNSKYPDLDYRAYEYHFESEWAQEELKSEDDALECISAFNELYLENRGEDVESWYEQSLLHPIDEESANDESSKDQYRQSASSLSVQWNSFYDTLLDGVISEDIEDNEYYKLYKVADELIEAYNHLLNHNVYLTSGAINEYCGELQSVRKALADELKEIEKAGKHRKVTDIVSIKKKEWKLLYKALNDSDLVYKIHQFDWKFASSK